MSYYPGRKLHDVTIPSSLENIERERKEIFRLVTSDSDSSIQMQYKRNKEREVVEEEQGNEKENIIQFNLLPIFLMF